MNRLASKTWNSQRYSVSNHFFIRILQKKQKIENIVTLWSDLTLVGLSDYWCLFLSLQQMPSVAHGWILVAPVLFSQHRYCAILYDRPQRIYIGMFTDWDKQQSYTFENIIWLKSIWSFFPQYGSCKRIKEDQTHTQNTHTHTHSHARTQTHTCLLDV